MSSGITPINFVLKESAKKINERIKSSFSITVLIVLIVKNWLPIFYAFDFSLDLSERVDFIEDYYSKYHWLITTGKLAMLLDVFSWSVLYVILYLIVNGIGTLIDVFQKHTLIPWFSNLGKKGAVYVKKEVMDDFENKIELFEKKEKEWVQKHDYLNRGNGWFNQIADTELGSIENIVSDLDSQKKMINFEWVDLLFKLRKGEGNHTVLDDKYDSYLNTLLRHDLVYKKEDQGGLFSAPNRAAFNYWLTDKGVLFVHSIIFRIGIGQISFNR